MYPIPDAILIWAVTQKVEVLRDAPGNISTICQFHVVVIDHRSRQNVVRKKLAHEEIDLATF